MRRRSSKILFGVLCAGAAAMAQSGAGEFASVSGIVTNSVTGQPVLRAHVLVSPQNSAAEAYGALTDAAGKFSVVRVPPGSYSVAVQRTGYIPGGSAMLKLQAGDDKSDLRLSLMPSGWITGRVLESSGEPVEGASVQLGGGFRSVKTDDKGQYRISGLTPGRYKLMARMPEGFFSEEVRVDGSADVHYAATYYPSSIDSQSASRVVVRAGAETAGIDIRLVRSPIVRVSGVVRGFPAGVRNVTVHLQSSNLSDRVAGVKADGKFEIAGVDPGHYFLSASTHDPKQFLQTAPVELDVSQSDIADVELRVVAPFNISGVLRYEDELAKPPDLRSKPAVWLQRAGGSNLGRISPVEIGAEGSFAFESVAPGRYIVALSWQNGYVKSVQLGPTSMEGRILDLTYNTGAGALSVLVSSSFAEISGKVDGAPDAAKRFVVVATPDPLEGSNPYYASLGTDGLYRLAGLPPGKYKLGVMEKEGLNPSMEIDDPVEVTVSAGEKATKDLRAPVV